MHKSRGFSIYELMDDLISTLIPEAGEKELEVLSYIDEFIKFFKKRKKRI